MRTGLGSKIGRSREKKNDRNRENNKKRDRARDKDISGMLG